MANTRHGKTQGEEEEKSTALSRQSSETIWPLDLCSVNNNIARQVFAPFDVVWRVLHSACLVRLWYQWFLKWWTSLHCFYPLVCHLIAPSIWECSAWIFDLMWGWNFCLQSQNPGAVAWAVLANLYVLVTCGRYNFVFIDPFFFNWTNSGCFHHHALECAECSQSRSRIHVVIRGRLPLGREKNVASQHKYCWQVSNLSTRD